MKHEEDWWLGGFFISCVIGLMASLIYTWYIHPVNPFNPYTRPDQLNPTDKELYTVLIGATYRYDNDLLKAQNRLARLRDKNIHTTIVNLAEKHIYTESDLKDIRSLVNLAVALGETPPILKAYFITPTPKPTHTPTITPTPSNTPSPTLTPTPTNTPMPTDTQTVTPTPTNTATPMPTANDTNTATPIPTHTATPLPTYTSTSTSTFTPTSTPFPTVTPTLSPNSPFGLAYFEVLCDDKSDGLLKIYVNGINGEGESGISIMVSWTGGQNRVFTGLKSPLEPGYADFQMEPGQIYQIEILGMPNAIAKNVNKLSGNECPDLAQDILPSWQVVFQRGATP